MFSLFYSVISWKIILQSTIFLSTKENEHILGVPYASVVGSIIFPMTFHIGLVWS